MYVLKYVRNDTEQRHTHTGIQIFKKASFDVHVYNTQCTWPTLQKASMGNGAFHSRGRRLCHEGLLVWLSSLMRHADSPWQTKAQDRDASQASGRLQGLARSLRKGQGAEDNLP